jgi:predicted ATP-dependent endonuclease of OLD family
MLLKTVFIRFYKSFNYDYLRKQHPNAVERPWEMLDGKWYPFVQIPIDSKVTTVVGANESGKSHLLSAIRKGISGQEIKHQDFCRYSQFFTVRQGELRLPDFGLEFSSLSEEDEENIRSACDDIPKDVQFDNFLIFRTNGVFLQIYLLEDGRYNRYDINKKNVDDFADFLPHVFKLKSNIALPGSVPIKQLIRRVKKPNGTKFEFLERQERNLIRELLDVIAENPQLYVPRSQMNQPDEEAVKTVKSLVSTLGGSKRTEAAKKREQEFELAYDLICKVAQVAPESLLALADSLSEGDEGHANGVIEQINRHLADSLNFHSWWGQDKDFRLLVSTREHDIAFTIRDRTGTEYSFEERSNGLKYFLSYYVQYKAHQSLTEKPEILLMDEPDPFLSSQAQQDLLKIFEKFANPDDGKPPVQVIYVTHSPFLIDKNRAERIRVLEKGEKDEGTRVVRDVARNHYEPLRSAFPFLGETTFIGNCNLMVEGLADQILIAGASAHLFRKGASKELETLDLNRITIVPAGSASSIPYLVYLARGRDIEKPAVVVLLDGDAAGNDAKKHLKRGGAYGKQLLRESFIFQIADLAKDSGLQLSKGHLPVEIEDLIPISICVQAAQVYAKDICLTDTATLASLTEETLLKKLSSSKTVFKALEACFKELSEEGLHIDKVGFARSVVDVVNQLSKQKSIQESSSGNSLEAFETNFKILFRQLNKMRRNAERRRTDERVSQKIDRLKHAFLQDHPVWVRRDQATLLMDDIEALLSDDDDDLESKAAKLIIQSLRQDHFLEHDMTKAIEDYEKFKEGLEQIKYAGRVASQENSEITG